MASRAFNQPKNNTIKAPSNLEEWRHLMRQAIDRAEIQNDRRAAGLRKALADGNAEKHLRQLGIISPADILREFPNKD
jgi:hypothetical protein